jgi:hypothetical protein
MFVVTEEDEAAIRAVYEQRGEIRGCGRAAASATVVFTAVRLQPQPFIVTPPHHEGTSRLCGLSRCLNDRLRTGG